MDATRKIATKGARRVFQFVDLPPLIDKELELRLVTTTLPSAFRRNVSAPTYYFLMVHRETRERMGYIDLRVGRSEYITHYLGHIGYRVKEDYRGHSYAARSCRLLFPLAAGHDIDPLWITCDPNNPASRRTCVKAGGEMVDILPVPSHYDMYRRGEHFKCRYRFDLSSCR